MEENVRESVKEEYYQRNSLTNHTDNKWKVVLWKMVYQYLFRPSPKVIKSWRNFLLRCFGAKIDKKCYVSPYAIITKPWAFEMGYYSSVDDNCYIIPPVKIGDYCAIANNCHLIGGGHDIWSRGFEQIRNPIEIGHGVFLGSGCYVAMGCKVGTMSVVGAHCKVLSNVPENTIVTELPVKTVQVKRIKTEDFDKYKYNH